MPVQTAVREIKDSNGKVVGAIVEQDGWTQVGVRRQVADDVVAAVMEKSGAKAGHRAHGGILLDKPCDVEDHSGCDAAVAVTYAAAFAKEKGLEAHAAQQIIRDRKAPHSVEEMRAAVREVVEVAERGGDQQVIQEARDYLQFAMTGNIGDQQRAQAPTA